MGESRKMNIAILILLVGLAVVLSILIKASFERAGVPAIIGYLALGFFLNLADRQWTILSKEGIEIFEFLAALGIFCLLFRVGLESDLIGLIKQLRRASLIWAGNFSFSGFLGFATAYFLMGVSLIPSLFVGAALTATSIGIAVGAWEEANALDSPNGRILLDVAEMDDISGVILMALLLAIAPVLKKGDTGSLLPILGTTTIIFLFKGLLFTAACFFFSRYLEKPVTSFFRIVEPAPDPMLMVAGLGFIIAASAEMLGFSVAIGAFFAGLAFSRDPETVKMEASFSSIYDLFAPFFFIGVGLEFNPEFFTSYFGLGSILLLAAILGKIVGTAGPALLICGRYSALLLGISMAPRAEIAMIIMQRAADLGSWAAPAQVFGAMVFVSAASSLVVPLVLRRLLTKWPQNKEQLGENC